MVNPTSKQWLEKEGIIRAMSGPNACERNADRKGKARVRSIKRGTNQKRKAKRKKRNEGDDDKGGRSCQIEKLRKSIKAKKRRGEREGKKGTEGTMTIDESKEERRNHDHRRI
jgi:hypothetical protein